nr:hypothetical protein [Tanacetum cinerariifolium]
MVAILEKSEYNVDFHPIVDFFEASPLRIKTTKEGTKILATVDGILRTVTESSLKRNLKLQDEEGISSLPDVELFENLTLMGYNISPNQKFTFQKASRVAEVHTGGGSIPTAGPPAAEVPTVGGSSASYQIFVDLLKHLDREDLNQLWALVKESLRNRVPTSDKEIELWVELKRLYEPNDEDQLWTYTQNLMHAPVEWKLYDTCEVHHVTAKDKEIFMLVEKDYPLRKGLAIGMIICKLQVENYSKMANDLIMKIYKIGRIVGNKMHKAFSLPAIEFPLAEEVPTANEES